MQNSLLTNFKPEPIQKPAVDAQLKDLAPLARSMECIRYSLLNLEFWISPEGYVREWLRRNLLLCAWLVVPAFFVLPVVGFIFWQVSGWLSMLTGIVGKLILVLGFLFVLRIATAFIKR